MITLDDYKINDYLNKYVLYTFIQRGVKHPTIDFNTAYKLQEKAYMKARNRIKINNYNPESFRKNWTDLMYNLNRNPESLKYAI